MVNMAGMIPLDLCTDLSVFSSFDRKLLHRGQDLRVSGIQSTRLFGGTGWVYPVFFFVLVVGFTFFYTDVLFTQQNYG